MSLDFSAINNCGAITLSSGFSPSENSLCTTALPAQSIFNYKEPITLQPLEFANYSENTFGTFYTQKPLVSQEQLTPLEPLKTSAPKSKNVQKTKQKTLQKAKKEPVAVASPANNDVTAQQTRGFWGNLWDGVCNFFNSANNFIKQKYTKIKQWIVGAPAQGKNQTFMGATLESVGNASLNIATYPISVPLGLWGVGIESCTPLFNYFSNKFSNS